MSEDGMATDEDRRKAAGLLAGLLFPYGSETQVSYVNAIAAALAEERERERSQWNPMVGRVLQVAMELEREAPDQEAWDGNVQATYREIAQRIHDAIRGDR